MAVDELLDNLTFSVPSIDGRGKLKELILYISQQCLMDPTYGKVKLNKILYNADFAAFFEDQIPVTGVAYQHIDYGPAPKMMKPVLDEMERDCDVVVTPPSYDCDYERVVARRKPDLNKLEPRDLAYIDAQIRRLWNQTAAWISTDSHGKPWRVSRDRQSIPYEAAFLSDEDVTESDILATRELSREHDWATL